MRFIVWVEERGVCFDRPAATDQSGSGSAGGVARFRCGTSKRSRRDLHRSREQTGEKITPPGLPLPPTEHAEFITDDCIQTPLPAKALDKFITGLCKD
jgi:hypothetical protein